MCSNTGLKPEKNHRAHSRHGWRLRAAEVGKCFIKWLLKMRVEFTLDYAFGVERGRGFWIQGVRERNQICNSFSTHWLALVLHLLEKVSTLFLFTGSYFVINFIAIWKRTSQTEKIACNCTVNINLYILSARNSICFHRKKLCANYANRLIAEKCEIISLFSPAFFPR